MTQRTSDGALDATLVRDVGASGLEATAVGGEVPPTARAPLGPGEWLRQYEVIRELGGGGMGRVVLARDTRLGRRVAIKVLKVRSPDLAARFLVEARLTAQLQHENIVVIHEVDEADGAPYMVLEYLEGAPLTAHLREGGVPAARAVELVVPVVRALVRAHDAGIVHRDLKPDNIVVTSDGVVKVLDFGIAKALAAEEPAPSARPPSGDLVLTQEGALIGTLAYMAPEQVARGDIDGRADIYAVGVMLHQLLAGKHPVDPFDAERIWSAASDPTPFPSVATHDAELPRPLVEAVDGCLRKRRDERIASPRELLALLEPLLPDRRGRVAEGEPYLGLTAFQEQDAARFFGRTRDTARAVARLRERPLLAITGPSGVGKSSFVRAGIIPALKASGEAWEALTIRPGRDPIATLAAMVQPLAKSTAPDRAEMSGALSALAVRLREEPGALGSLLRARARSRDTQILVFVDQLEELYTLASSPDDRRAFAAAIAAAADDVASPLRVLVSIRSDFLDRVVESDALLAEVSRGLAFLAPPDDDGLRDALVRPLEQVGHRFESPAIVEDVLATLRATPNALPLLQFVASRLWSARDRNRRTITESSYAAIGGVAGALAQHADHAYTEMSAESQRLARTVMLRLVTPERTRAVVDVADLAALGPPGAVQRVIDHLVAARLLVVQTRGEAEGTAVEIVHESLIRGWPRLQRWLDESHEESAFVAQLATAARQWDARGRPAGLVWTGEPAADSARWAARIRDVLPPRDRAFLDAVLALATRARRRRRKIVAIVAASAVLVAGGTAVGIWRFRSLRTAAVTAVEDTRKKAATAEQAAEAQAARADRSAQIFESNAAALAERNKELSEALERLQLEKRRSDVARDEAVRAATAIEEERKKLEKQLEELKKPKKP